MSRTLSYDKHNRPQWSETTKADERRSMERARQRDELAQMAYEEGLKEGKSQSREAAKKPKSKSAGRVRREIRRPIEQGTMSAVRDLQAPVRRNVAGGLRTVGLTFAVLGLYLFLESAQHVEGALGGVKKAVDWLGSPDRSIPFAKES